MDPYDILGIPHDADDATITRAYEALIRRYPARKYPEKYREIQEAYKKVRSKKGRLEYYMFHREERLLLHVLDRG